jgi:hypothetical protein
MEEDTMLFVGKFLKDLMETKIGKILESNCPLCREDRYSYVNLGRQMGHTHFAVDYAKTFLKLFPHSVTVIGLTYQTLEPYRNIGTTVLSAQTVERGGLCGLRKQLIIVDTYQYVKHRIPDLEAQISCTNPIFALYLQ